MSNEKNCIGMIVAGVAWVLATCGSDTVIHPDQCDTIYWRMTAIPYYAYIGVFQPDQPHVVDWYLWTGVFFFYFVLLLGLVLLVIATPGIVRDLASRIRWKKNTNEVR